ncbi:MAG: SH3 domain-containing protein [Devosia sp.]
MGRGDSAAPERLVVTAPARLPAAATPAGGAARSFEASLFVTANSLNLRESPSTSARVLGSLSRNSVVRVGERRGGWVNVSVDGVVPFGHRPHGLLGLKSATGAFHPAVPDRRRSG